MKVICINNKPLPDSCHTDILKKLQEGHEYEVYDIKDGVSFVSGRMGIAYYLTGINERPEGLCSSRFLQLSDIDETELVNEKQETLIQ